MQPSHVLDFVDFKLDEYQKRYDKNKADFDIAKAEYENTRWNKFWGNKYTLDWLYNAWDFQWVDMWMDELRVIRREAEYKHKMDYMRMDIPENWQNQFYKWAADNKIPF
jgi:hypothetical protein